MKTLVIFVISFISLGLSAESLSIRSDHWYPINGKPHDANPGFMIDIATEILAPKGIDVDYQTSPWARAIVSVRNGSIDCVVGAYKSDVPDFIFPKLAWGMDQNIFYVAKSNDWQYTGLDSLLNKKIGLIYEYSYTEALDNFIQDEKNKKLFEFTYSSNALEQNIIKVLAGRLTATLESHLVMPEKLKELGLEGQLLPAGKIGQPVPMYIACSPKKDSSQQYIKWFDEGIMRLRNSGRLNEILAKYHLRDWLD